MEDQQNNILVSICCLTYNHVKYIRECLDGILFQECNFNYEILIHDDASDDGTIDIINEYQRNYPKLVKPLIQSENQWSKGVRAINQKFNYSRARGKYIALCEGDDYWTDPLKLQKQIDYLENNSEISIVCAGYSDSEGKISVLNVTNNVNNWIEFNIEEWTEYWYTKTLTVVFRKDLYLKVNEILKKYNLTRDTHLYYHLLKCGNGAYLDENVGFYNIHPGGVCSMVDKKKNALIAFNIAEEIYKLNKEEISKKLYFNSLLGVLIVNNYSFFTQPKLFFKTLFKAGKFTDICRVFYHSFF